PTRRSSDLIWIAGNHDPDPADGIGGSFGGALAIGGLVFRHEPTGAKGEIAGHLHPVARVTGGGRSVSRRCFECERLARNGPPDHRETLIKIANAWRELAINAEKRNKNTPA